MKHIADIIHEVVTPNKEPDKEFLYVGVPDIDQNTGRIINISRVKGGEIRGSKVKFMGGDIIFARIEPCVYNKKTALVPKEVADCLGSTEFIVIRPGQQVLPEFLLWVLRSDLTIRQVYGKVRGATGRRRLYAEDLMSIAIPCPDLSTQENVVKIIEEAHRKRSEAYKRAEGLLNSINDCVLEKLGIEVPKVEEKRSFVVYHGVLNKRYDVFYYQPKYTRIEESFKKGKYELKELKEVVRFSKETTNPTEEPEKIFRYIEIANVDSKFGKIDSVKEILGKDAPSRARKVLRAGDIVVSTLRESLKSIAIVPKELDGCIGTTGFAVLRPAIDREFLYAILRADPIQDLMRRRATGAIMPAIVGNDLKSIKLPIPPIEIQNEIAEEVKRCKEKAERLREEAEDVVKQAKEKVEKIILGDGKVGSKQLEEIGDVY